METDQEIDPKEKFWNSALAGSQILMQGFGDEFAAQASQMMFQAPIFC